MKLIFYKAIFSFALFSIYIGTCNYVYSQNFYISPQGNDNNIGSKQFPFKTLNVAKERVRVWKKNHSTGDIHVWLSGGNYNLDKTLMFGPEDGGAPGQQITYEAIPGGQPIINSDQSLKGWVKVDKKLKGLPKIAEGKIWVTHLPVNISDFNILFNSKGLLPRARTNPLDHKRLYSNYWMGPAEFQNTIPFDKKIMDSIFYPLHAEIHVIPVAAWTMDILPVQSMDTVKGLVTLTYPSTYTLAATLLYAGPNPNTIWVENTFAGMQRPGNWVFDKNSREVYYWPVNNVQPEDDLVIPRLIEMCRIEGNIDYGGSTDIPVSYLSLKGLTFNHGNRFNSAGQSGLGLQHDWERFDTVTALLRLRGTSNCKIINCSFENSGGAAIRLDLYAQNDEIISNTIHDLGGMGILLDGYGPGNKDVNKNNLISNNRIHDIGKIWWQSIGIWAWQSGSNKITHNTLYNLPYSGIAVTGRIGWDKNGKAECSKTIRWSEVGNYTGSESWDEREKFLHSRDNLLEENDISNVMLELYDGNAIYISGAGHGNKVKGNYVHHSDSKNAGEAIRCDDDQNDTFVENNIIFKYGSYGVGFCSKGRNYFINNIIACPLVDSVIKGFISPEPQTPNEMTGSVFSRNIVYAQNKHQPFVYYDGIKNIIKQIKIENNIYFNCSDASEGSNYLNWAKQNGAEQNSTLIDPLFKDAANGIFELKSNSPALLNGFIPIVIKPGITTINQK